MKKENVDTDFYKGLTYYQKKEFIQARKCFERSIQSQ